MPQRDLTGVHAPEFPHGLRWFNSEPLSIRGLSGKLVLIDFWTYSCVNCIRTLPTVRAWHERYAKKGLIIVGVHAPEFDFEKDAENVERALREFGIHYPVVQDNDLHIWSLYTNAWWPRKLLINGEGVIVYDHIGEGDYAETERRIQTELIALGISAKTLPPIAETHEHGGGICYPSTSETYLGSERGTPDVPKRVGAWAVHPQYLEHTSASEGWDDYLSLRFRGTEVNLVMAGTDAAVEVKAVLNGMPLNDIRGAEVGSDDIIKVKKARMYGIIKSNQPLDAELRLYVRTSGLRCYAFTFGGCVD